MNQTRTFLLFAWLFVAVLLFMEWNREPQTNDTATATATELPQAAPASATLPSASALPPVQAGAAEQPAATVAPQAQGKLVELANDVLRLRIDTRGAKVVGAELLTYPVTKDVGSPNVRLFDDNPSKLFQADIGLLNGKGEPLTANAVFEEQRSADSQTLTLVWQDATTGLTVRKTLRLSPGSYVIEARQEIENAGTASQLVYPYEELTRVAPPPIPAHSGITDPEAYSFVGAAWYSPEDKFEKRKFEDFAEEGPLSKDVTGGWIGMLQHHFLAAWVPVSTGQRRFSVNQANVGPMPLFTVRAIAAVQAAPGETAVSEAKLWVGPKLQAELDDLAPSLKLSVDYGILTFLAQPVFDWVLAPLYALTGNWGWAIILTVVILKLLLYPLSAAQFRSFAKLRAVQPRIEALKERYGEDKQKFQMAMMELYKKEKINPVGGCLPILLTIPVFIALYWVLLESVELRQAPWIGWIDNLTAADPYFILPAINLLVMWLTQKMTPSPGMDPLQRKMMQWMPVIFGVMFAFFPSGLVLYWCTNGVLGLVQQWFITKRHDQQNAAVVSK